MGFLVASWRFLGRPQSALSVNLAPLSPPSSTNLPLLAPIRTLTSQLGLKIGPNALSKLIFHRFVIDFPSIFHVFFVTHGVRDEVYAKRCDLKKTLCFTSPNACQSFCGLCVHDSKIHEKSSQNLFCNASRYGSLSESTFSNLEASKWSPRTPWNAWKSFQGHSWALLGRFWDALGALLACPWNAQRRSGDALGPSWSAPGSS